MAIEITRIDSASAESYSLVADFFEMPEGSTGSFRPSIGFISRAEVIEWRRIDGDWFCYVCGIRGRYYLNESVAP